MRSEERLGTEKLPKLMVSLAAPAIVAQLVNLLYNMVDRMYIGRMAGVGDLALTGLGLCNPIILIISAFAAFAGNGGAPLAAIELGRGDRDEAEKILGSAVTMLLCFSAVLTAVFLVFKVPLLYLFGASDNTVSYANGYLTIYLIGTVFVQLALGLNTFISSQGQARTAMLSVLIGAVTNIVLDPILIFALGMGVQGAALATIISQALSAAWIVYFLCSSRSSIRIRAKYMLPSARIIGKIASLGVSPFIMQSTESLISIVFNSGLQKYGGDLYVGSMTILNSVMQLKTVPLMGFSNGVQPIISYNYGAGNYDRVKRTFRLMLIISLGFCTAFCLAVFIVPTAFARIFTDKPELIELVGKVLPIYMGAMWIFAVQTSVQVTFLGLGQAKVSLFIACLRKIILLTPLALILPTHFGVMGIYWAEPISDLISATTSGILFIIISKRLLKKKDMLS